MPQKINAKNVMPSVKPVLEEIKLNAYLVYHQWLNYTELTLVQNNVHQELINQEAMNVLNAIQNVVPAKQ
jgi:hypothetical protein